MALVKNCVGKKITKDEICEHIIEGKDVVDSSRNYICLIERQGDHALFVYESSCIPCVSDTDLKLKHVFPVNKELKLNAELTSTDKSANKACELSFQVKDVKHVYELTDSHGVTFIAELKNKIAIQSQNEAFALPSTFSWLQKYEEEMKKTGTARPVSSSNPFLDDVFDPLHYMNIEKSNSKVVVNEGESSFYDDFQPTASSNTGNNCNQHDFTESLDVLAQEQLGLTGTSMADGLKPLTAREKLVEHILKQRQSEFVRIENFRIFVGTWNVNGQNTTTLEEWLACDKDPPDIYAVGFQELDLSNQAYIFSDSARETEWQQVVYRHLHPKAKYQKIKSIRLVGVLLLVYIKECHIQDLKLIDTDSVPTGIMGMLGNKGGVGVRFSLHDTSLLFINSHLAAHQDEFERRNQDSHDIEGRMKFKQFLPPLTVHDHDLVFWIGDLNYRIDMDINTVKDLVQKNMLTKLMANDQLYRQLSTNAIYKTYTEGAINFPPTYKYDPGTDNFDSSEKSRIPAWCDRILWKGTGVKQLIYRSHPALRISDHKPVSSLFDAGVKVIEKDRYKRVYEDIMKQIDRLENDYLPQVTLSQREFVFNDIKFEESRVQTLTIANTGQVVVTYEFINKPEEDSYCKPWMNVTPCTSVIEPGLSVEMSLEVFVDKNMAYQFNCGHEHIDDILVLHLHHGKDFFIPISGNYIVSGFGSSIEALVQMHGPIREVPTDKLVDLERPGSLDNVDILAEGTRLYACPKEIFKMVDHIWHYGRHQEELFRQPGLNTELHMIRDCLDTGTPPHIPGGVHSVCAALILFLESLAEPVIPYSLYENCIECSNNSLLSKQIVSTVPDCHKNVFKYLCAFLRQLLEEAQYNNLDIKYLAQLFGNTFLRPPPMRSGKSNMRNVRRQQVLRSEEMKKSAFLYHFLAHPYDE